MTLRSASVLTLASAPASAADTPRCVTKKEYRRPAGRTGPGPAEAGCSARVARCDSTMRYAIATAAARRAEVRS